MVTSIDFLLMLLFSYFSYIDSWLIRSNLVYKTDLVLLVIV